MRRVAEAGDARRDAGSRSGRSRGVRRIGPGRGRPDVARVSSSRTKSASAVGSVTGSFANGVRRFSRLFSAQVYAEPDAETTVPNAGVGDDVDPGQRRLLVAVEHDHVLAPAVGEAADAVGEA